MPACSPPEHASLVLATFVNHFFSFGPLYSFGVFLPTLKAHFDTSIDAVSAVYSVMASMQFFGSLLAGLLIPKHLRHRTVTAASSVVVLAGYLLAASVDSLVLMYVAMAVVGLGLGASNLAALTALNARVRERRALAVGIAACGTSVGTIVQPPIYSAWIAAVGWRWALRLTGFAAAAAIGITAPAFWVPAPAGPFAGVGPSGGAKANTGSAARAQAKPAFPPCRDVRYLCWWINMLICMCGYLVVPSLLAQYGQEEVGASPEATSAMYTIFGVSALTTRGLLGCITALVGGPRRVHWMSQVGVGLATLALPFCRSTEALMVWSAFYGLFIGPLIAVISVVLSELFGTEVLPLYHGVSRLAVGIGTFVGPPAIGYVVDTAGYDAAFPLAGGLVLSGTVFLALLARLQARHLRQELPGSADNSCDRDDGPNSNAGDDAAEVGTPNSIAADSGAEAGTPNLITADDGVGASTSPDFSAKQSGGTKEPDRTIAKPMASLGMRLCCPMLV